MSFATIHGKPLKCQLLLDERLEALVAETGREEDRYSLGHLLLTSLRNNPEFVNTIECSSGERILNKELLDKSVRTARALRGVGVKKGDVVMIVGTRHLLLSVPYYASTFIGAVSLHVDENVTATELSNYIKLSEPKCIFADANIIKTVVAVENTTVISFGQEATPGHQDLSEFIRGISADLASFSVAETNRDHSAVLTCTSGSTGAPKAVVLTNYGIIVGSILFGINPMIDLPEPGRQFFLLSSCQWLSYVAFTNLCTILGYHKLQTIQPATASHAIQIMRKYRPESMLLTPGFAVEMLQATDYRAGDLSSLRAVLSGAAYVSPQLQERLWKEIHPEGKLVVCAGCSEIAGMYSMQTPDCSFESVGKEINILEYKIVDENEKEVPVGVTGELWIRGKDCFSKGYYKDEITTKETFTPDGWTKTGDLLYKDEKGQYIFVDRKKLLIKVGSYHIYPLEVEGVIAEVAGVAKAGVCMTDRGLAALVEPRPGAVVTAQQVHDAVNGKLSYYKQLVGGVLFVPALPQTVSGKLNRAALKEMLCNGSSNS